MVDNDRFYTEREPRTLQEYNERVTSADEIMTGKEFRRHRRKQLRK